MMRVIQKLILGSVGIVFLSVSLSELLSLTSWFFDFGYLSIWAVLYNWDLLIHISLFFLFLILAVIFWGRMLNLDQLDGETSKPSFLIVFVSFLKKHASINSLSWPILTALFLVFQYSKEVIPTFIYFALHPKIQLALLLLLFIYIPLFITSNLIILLNIRTEYKKLPLLLLWPLILNFTIGYIVFSQDQRTIDSTRMGREDFYLVGEGSRFESGYYASLTRCEFLECDVLYRQGSNGGRFLLYSSEELEEVYLFQRGFLTYIYGDEEAFDIDRTYLNHFWDYHADKQLIVYLLEAGDFYRLVLFWYQGNDNKYDVLPVKIYIDPESELWKPIFEGRDLGIDGDLYFDIEVDEGGKASVSVEDMLIYSYGSQSQCHVESCEIVGP